MLRRVRVLTPPSLRHACAQVKKEEAGSIHVVKQRQLHLNCDLISLSVGTSRPITSSASRRG